MMFQNAILVNGDNVKEIAESTKDYRYVIEARTGKGIMVFGVTNNVTEACTIAKSIAGFVLDRNSETSKVGA